MSARIVVFGATGYTGEQTVRELVARGAQPVLAGRSAQRLDRLADELGGLETRVADVSQPRSVTDLVEPGDVLVSTVGPFTQWVTRPSRPRSRTAPGDTRPLGVGAVPRGGRPMSSSPASGSGRHPLAVTATGPGADSGADGRIR